MSSGHGLPDNDDFESISSTNLTIMSSLNPYDQSSLKRITKTISPSSTKQQLSTLYSKEKERKERQNSASSRRQERGTTQPKKPPVVDVSSNDRNELKQVFAKLQHKSVAQKLRQHLEEEEAEGAKPVKETRDEDLKDIDGGSTANVKSM